MCQNWNYKLLTCLHSMLNKYKWIAYDFVLFWFPSRENFYGKVEGTLISYAVFIVPKCKFRTWQGGLSWFFFLGYHCVNKKCTSTKIFLFIFGFERGRIGHPFWIFEFAPNWCPQNCDWAVTKLTVNYQWSGGLLITSLCSQSHCRMTGCPSYQPQVSRPT